MRLTFKKKDSCDEYIVLNKDEQVLGQIAKKKRGTKWWFFPASGIFDDDLWLSKGCLREIADFMAGIE